MSSTEKTITRAELAKELRQRAAYLRKGDVVFLMAQWNERPLTPQLLESAAAALEEEDQNARRYQVFKSMYGDEPRWFRVDSNQGRIMGIRSTGIENKPENENRWHPTLDAALDAALDAWIEEHGLVQGKR